VIAAGSAEAYDRAIEAGEIAGSRIMKSLLSPILAAFMLIAASPGHAEHGRMQGYDFEFTSIEGDKLALAQFRGRPILVVNTASF
jgi:hypothetical protein